MYLSFSLKWAMTIEVQKFVVENTEPYAKSTIIEENTKELKPTWSISLELISEMLVHANKAVSLLWLPFSFLNFLERVIFPSSLNE